MVIKNVLQINNATTLSNINTGNNGGGDIRWLEHDDNNLLFQYSDGCFVTTVDNQKELLERLKNWNTSYGYQIKTTIY